MDIVPDYPSDHNLLEEAATAVVISRSIPSTPSKQINNTIKVLETPVCKSFLSALNLAD